MRSLVSAFWGPRTPTLRRREAGSAAAAGANFARSADWIWRTTPLRSTSGLDLATAGYFTRVGFAQAYDANPVSGFGEAKNMQPVGKHAKCDVSRLPEFLALVNEHKGRLEVELGCLLEREAAVADVAVVLVRVEADARRAE